MYFEKIFCFCVFCLFFMVLSGVSIDAAEILPELYKFNLPNGLSTIIKKNHRSPVVAVQVWVKAGSVYETDKEAGITHLIEHMLFKGTDRRKTGDVAREIESVGGSINAFTSLDYTCYHCEVPGEHLKTALDVLSDVVFHSKFDPKELEREKEVVLEELRMREDRPETRLSRLVMENVYMLYPYKRPVIGYVDTVRSFTREDILTYMKRRYKNQYIRLVVVGDVDVDNTIQAVSETFGIRYEDNNVTGITEEKFVNEPNQIAPKIKSDKMEVQQHYMSLAFSGIPDVKHPDVAGLDVLSSLLSGGYSSVLVRELKNNKMLVQKIDTSSFTPQGPGFFEIEAVLQGEKLKSALEEIYYYLDRLKENPPSPEELKKAKLNVTASFVYSLETMEGEARKIGTFEILTNDPASERQYLERVKSVTPEDIQRIARLYFSPEKANLTLIQPLNSPDFNATSEFLMNIAKKAEERVNQEFDKKKDKKEEKILKTRISSGLDVIILESKEVSSVSFQALFWGGLRYENPQNNGIYNYLGQSWNKGTKNMTAEEFAAEIDRLGGGLSGYSGQNTFGINGKFLSENINRGLELFSDMILYPKFSQEEVEKLRPVIISQIKSQEDSLSSVAALEMRKMVFAPHPYAMKILGSEDIVRNIRSEDLINIWNDFVRPDNGILVIVGDVNREEILKKLEEQLGIARWKKEAPLKKITPQLPAPVMSNKISIIPKDKQQVHLILGFPGLTFDSPDRFSLEVLNSILAGQSGRLFMTLRDKESLAYGVSSFINPGIEAGAFAFYIACAPDKKDDAIRGLWREITEITNAPVTQAELDRAKKWITGNHIIDLQTNSSKALDMGANDLYGLGYDYSKKYIQSINAVTIENVQNIAKKLLMPDKYVLVQVGQ